MLRTVFLFFCMLGFLAAEVHAGSAATAASRPIHRRKPMAGNYRPVYRYYRGAGRHKNQFAKGIFKRRSTAARPLKSRRRGTM